MLEFDPDLEEVGDRPLADSLGDTSRELLLLQMISRMLMMTARKMTSMLSKAVILNFGKLWALKIHLCLFIMKMMFCPKIFLPELTLPVYLLLDTLYPLM